jgi:anthranilate synthase component I
MLTMKTKFHFSTNSRKILSDIYTPVELYLKIRDVYSHSFLLESSDYKSKENSYSYICINPIAAFKANHSTIEMSYPDQSKITLSLAENKMSDTLYSFISCFQTEKLPLDFVTNGLFGYTSYDAIPLFEDITFTSCDFDLPLVYYQLFRNIIVFNHFNNELYILDHSLEGEQSNLDEIEALVQKRTVVNFPFVKTGSETSNFTNDQFLDKIKTGQQHCFRGDVFQLVLSRKYEQQFIGDEFNVYRALRSINPSPYLFYFDYVDFKMFGSSPEAQLTIKNKKAEIHPIAGTFKRTGNSEEDTLAAIALSKDEKEAAEHTMLVDLARNDLSKSSRNVKVERFKEIEYFSHVIHLVSKVTAELDVNTNPIQLLGETYPAGTLSGAPKHRAMQLIDKYEGQSRGFYGGAIGMIGFDDTFNHAIFIRSFVSRNNNLTFQAGCGIVAKSNPDSELEEVENKLKALRQALVLAENI